MIGFQAEPGPDMLERLPHYLVRMRRKLRPGTEGRGNYAGVGVSGNLTGPVQPDTLVMT